MTPQSQSLQEKSIYSDRDLSSSDLASANRDYTQARRESESGALCSAWPAVEGAPVEVDGQLWATWQRHPLLPRKYYLNGLEITATEYQRQKILSRDRP